MGDVATLNPPSGVCIWMHLVNGTGNSPSPGTVDPRSSQTGQVVWEVGCSYGG